jgi:hypothetical protein
LASQAPQGSFLQSGGLGVKKQPSGRGDDTEQWDTIKSNNLVATIRTLSVTKIECLCQKEKRVEEIVRRGKKRETPSQHTRTKAFDPKKHMRKEDTTFLY